MNDTDTKVRVEAREEPGKNGRTKRVLYTSEGRQVSCHSHDCEKELHCFYVNTKRPDIPKGRCQGCGEDLIEWHRPRRRDAFDMDHTISEMKREWIRHHFWTCEVDDNAKRLAHLRGQKKLRKMLRDELVGHLARPHPFKDGFAVGYDGDPIRYVRHATASCCRNCAEYWHGIEPGTEMTAEQIDYLAEIGIRFLRERFPDCGEEPDYSY